MAEFVHRSRLQRQKSLPVITTQNIAILFLLGGLLFLGFTAFSWHISDPDSIRILRTSSADSELRLMLASHGRLMWYYPGTDKTQVLHEGQGVHYGTFPGSTSSSGQLQSVWVVLRPHNWHPASTEEVLLELDAETGKQLSRVKVPSRFTHDAVRRGSTVYLCNTDQGSILELAYPSMNVVRTIPLFTKKEHINTLAPLHPGQTWVMLHNLGNSEMVRLDMPATSALAPSIAARISGVGTKSHGLVEWEGGFVSLDSDNGALVWVELPDEGGRSGGEAEGGAPTFKAHSKVLWKSPEAGKFLKGLAVVDGVAYFGISVAAPRGQRQDPHANSELAAFDLDANILLWRKKAPTHGLLNVVSAPHLGEASTYRAMSTGNAKARGPRTTNRWTRMSTRTSGKAAIGGSNKMSSITGSIASRSSSSSSGTTQAASPGSAAGSGGSELVTVVKELQAQRDSLMSNQAIKDVQKKIEDMGYPVRTGGHWGSGLPFLDLEVKATKGHSWETGLQLPLISINISALQAAVTSAPPGMWDPEENRNSNAVVDGRKDNMAKFKPGVKALVMIFSDQSIDNTYRFPYYDNFKDAIEPIMNQILGPGHLDNIVRMQFAMMTEGSTIRLHRDMGGYALKAHRIHIPVFTNPDISFEVCPVLDKRTNGRASDASITQPDDCIAIPMAEGMAFELNNRVLHRVQNGGPRTRVQLIVDVAESPRSPQVLKPGTVCQYVRAKIVCPETSIIL